MGLDRVVSSDFLFDVAKGIVFGHYHVNKFGLTNNADSGVDTDVWDAAAQAVWTAPLASRIHEILSSSNEDSDIGGVIAQGSGARIIRIFGLIDWDTPEVSEDVIMDGTDGTDTVNSYVIIHRMAVLTAGNQSTPNIGLITAVAEIEGTVTAQISIGTGQTLMAIYGIPSTQIAYIYSFSASITRNSPQDAETGITILQTMDVESSPAIFLVKHTAAIKESGTAAMQHMFPLPKKCIGPCIIKMSFNSGANDTIGDASFDAVIVDN